MTLCDTYSRFLATPSTGALADHATLHYVSTTTSITDATAIIKHLAVQEKLLKKTKQKILDAIEGNHGLSVDVETTIEFSNGGGAYLPGLDDNFVADRTVTFAMVHMVRFDRAGKITQIRQYWDQGSLLKQIDVIGARSRNWPIRDGSEQIRLITSNAAVAAANQPEASPSRPSTAASRGVDEVSISSRSRRSTNNAMNDPHASLSLFQPREIDEDDEDRVSRTSSQPSVPRSLSAKPPPREYSELFVGADGGSPSPSERIPTKAGSAKNFKNNRLFEDEDDHSADRAPMSIKTSSKKYDHFTFGEGEETPKVRDTSRPTRHDQHRNRNDAHWDFDDFATPNKSKPKTHPQAVRHFGWSDDEVSPFHQPGTDVALLSLKVLLNRTLTWHSSQDESPVRRPVVHKARPDADAHFDFVDDGTPESQRQHPTKGGRSNRGQGDVKSALSDVTAAVNEGRSKHFASQFDMTDNSPSAGKNGAAAATQTRNSMKTHWGTHQDSPENRGINIAGNGMGGRKGTEAAWSLYDESPAKKENQNTGARQGIKTEGDGMGGKKGADKSFWDF
ncbi:hypothetical protein PtrSN002B_005406 [Pyrenophora tritici-repentis]|nr:hypothetical protein Alg130_09603 [Pyrenophora tritici-repentis]KAI0582128.1 hypothetical protein Alg215_04327 [Pyrenophora tritici-repentis]KAI0609482.1 hypothetical protein TUN205_06256 [Pyrenophora tritici-repentis]KAI0624423.1 hypothetical protein TUN199_03607 [Pyrenophora tritici-repentis]KAI1551895.1 hypothetical protein PtrSN002B_005406 [Pyrenophora tritici-repentis]